MRAVYRHEVRSYFTGVSAYVFGAFLLLFAGIYTMAINIHQAYANFEYVLSNMSFIFMIIVPILTMRVISDERRQKTDSLLYSLPVSTTEIVAGKYLALLTVFAVPTVIIGIYPFILSAFGDVYLKASLCGLAGFFLLGAALIATGMFISSLTESQAAAAGICFAAVLLNYFIVSLSSFVSGTSGASFTAFAVMVLLLGLVLLLMTRSFFTAAAATIGAELVLAVAYLFAKDSFAGLFPDFMEDISLFSRFNTIVDGVFDLTAVIFYLSFIFVFCYLTVQSLEKRRWS